MSAHRAGCFVDIDWGRNQVSLFNTFSANCMKQIYTVQSFQLPVRASSWNPKLTHCCVDTPSNLHRARKSPMPTAEVKPDLQVEAVCDVANDSGQSINRRFSRALASNAQLLAKAELYFTAFLSMSDMVSDLVMVVSLSPGGDGRTVHCCQDAYCFCSHRPDIIVITRCHTPWPR